MDAVTACVLQNLSWNKSCFLVYFSDVREILKDDTVIISTQKTGAITGAVKISQIVPYKEKETSVINPKFVPYVVRVSTDILNVRSGPGTNYKITTQIYKSQLYTIVDEKNGWGKLKSGAGWIALNYTTKVK